jgi:hypothetical protein
MTIRYFCVITRFHAVRSADSFVPMMIVWPDPIDQLNDVTGDGQSHYSFISALRRDGLRILEWTHIQMNLWTDRLFKILHKF